jgi:hypothetical protein
MQPPYLHVKIEGAATVSKLLEAVAEIYKLQDEKYPDIDMNYDDIVIECDINEHIYITYAPNAPNYHI